MKVSRSFIVFILVFYFGDLLSTWYMLQNGWYELNPLGVTGMVLVKTVLVSWIYIFTRYWDKVDKRIVPITCNLISLISIPVIVNNFGAQL